MNGPKGKIIGTGLLSTNLALKPHAFMEIKFKSSMVYGMPLLNTVTIICLHLGAFVSFCFSLDMLYPLYNLSVTMLIDHIEIIISAILEINTKLSTELNNTGFDYLTLNQIHTNLTTHILYNQLLISLLREKVFVESPHLNQMQELFIRL